MPPRGRRQKPSASARKRSMRAGGATKSARARKSSASRSGARKAAARKRTVARKAGTRAAKPKASARKISARGASRAKAPGSSKTPKRAPVPMAAESSWPGVMTGEKHAVVTDSSEDLFAGTDDRDAGSIADEDLEQ